MLIVEHTLVEYRKFGWVRVRYLFNWEKFSKLDWCIMFLKHVRQFCELQLFDIMNFWFFNSVEMLIVLTALCKAYYFMYFETYLFRRILALFIF